jgi:hypothetical protein
VHEITGLPPERVDGRQGTYFKLVHPDDQPALVAWLELFAKGDGPYECEHRLCRPDGRQVQVNLLGAQALAHAVVPGMVERGRGDVVLVTSDVVRAPRPLMGAYMTAKAGLEGMTRAMQMELEGTGVRAGMVRPGPSSTEQGTGWTDDVVVEVVDEWSRWGLIRHDGALRPGDVARAVIAMVSQPRGTHLTLIEVEPEAPSVRRTHVPGGIP